MKLGILIALAIVLVGSAADGQSFESLFQKNGSERVYILRTATLARPWSTNRGNICGIELIPSSTPRSEILEIPPSPIRVAYSHGDTNKLFPSLVLNMVEIREIFDDLVPPVARQGRGRSSIDISGFGSSYSVRFEYDNVEIGLRLLRTDARPVSFVTEADLDRFFAPQVGEPVSAWIRSKVGKCAATANK